jgi:hypothetical protein
MSFFALGSVFLCMVHGDGWFTCFFFGVGAIMPTPTIPTPTILTQFFCSNNPDDSNPDFYPDYNNIDYSNPDFNADFNNIEK